MSAWLSNVQGKDLGREKAKEISKAGSLSLASETLEYKLYFKGNTIKKHIVLLNKGLIFIIYQEGTQIKKNK